MFSGITPNRAIFLYHLRVNPGYVKQIYGTLKTSVHDMCAVGLGCDAFNINMANSDAAYYALAEKLEVSVSDVRYMYILNDSYKLTFAEVAKVAEAFFNSDQTRSVLEVWNDTTKNGEI